MRYLYSKLSLVLVIQVVLALGTLSVFADVLGAWKKWNTSTGTYPADNGTAPAHAPAGYPVEAWSNHPKLFGTVPDFKSGKGIYWSNTLNSVGRFYTYNDNSWSYMEPWSTGVLVNGISARSQSNKVGSLYKPLTNYVTFRFNVSNGYKVNFTQFVTRCMNDEVSLNLQLRCSADDYTADMIVASDAYSSKISAATMTERNYMATTNFFRTYTNRLDFKNVRGPTFDVRMYGSRSKSQWVYTYFTNVYTVVSDDKYAFRFFGKVLPLVDMIPSNGPMAGGYTMLITNAFKEGSTNLFGAGGSDITKIVVNGNEVTTILGQGTNWARITMPASTNSGEASLYAYSTTYGIHDLSGEFIYNPTGIVLRASPTSGVAGASVSIIGSNLCNGANGDVTNMLFGTGTVVPTSLSPTQIVVNAPSGAGRVGVKIWSTSYGYTENTNIFTYEGSVSSPEIQVLGTNSAIIASGAAASVQAGTDFGAVARGYGRTNLLTITNNGTEALTISGVTTGGTGAAYFRVTGVPPSLAAGASATVSVAYAVSVGGTHEASVSIANNSLTTPFVVNLAGTTLPGIIGTVAASGVSTVGVVAAATTFSDPSPIKLEYTYYHQQHVYSAAQLAAAGLTNVQIAAMGFDVAQALSPHIQSNYVVRLKETARTGWTGGDKAMESSDLAQVYSNETVPFVVGSTPNLVLDSSFVLGDPTSLLVDCGFARKTFGFLDGRVNVQYVANSVVLLQRESSDALSVFDDGANAVTNLLPVMTVAWRRMANAGVSPAMCPSTGGVVVTISGTNLCNGTLGDVTSVKLCGAAATVQSVSGSTQLVVVAGAGGATGRGEVEIVSAQCGRTAVANLFTYNGAGVIRTVSPALGTNGMAVTISGTNLCNGTLGDVTSVTLAGIAAAAQSVSSSTQLVVAAGAGTPGLSGDVVVNSASFGLTTATNAFAYAAPQMQVLGTNLAPIASGDAPAGTVGTYYGVWKAGQETTHTFAITNVGIVDVDITGVSTNE